MCPVLQARLVLLEKQVSMVRTGVGAGIVVVMAAAAAAADTVETAVRVEVVEMAVRAVMAHRGLSNYMPLRFLRNLVESSLRMGTMTLRRIDLVA